jgi:hypothetical protein
MYRLRGVIHKAVYIQAVYVITVYLQGCYVSVIYPVYIQAPVYIHDIRFHSYILYIYRRTCCP